MKAVKVSKPNLIEVVEVEEPNIQTEDEVKIKVKTVGICGSDVGIYCGTNPMATYPRVIGHEMSGIVEEVGNNVKYIKEGDHVVVDPVNNCGICPACRSGHPNICYNLEVSGVHREGFFSEHIVAKEGSVYKIDKNIPWEKACLVEPFSIGANSTSLAKVTPNDTVLVLGAGTIGQTVIRTALLMGARVIATDFDEEKLDSAKKQGAILTINPNKEEVESEVLKATDNIGPNVVIDTVCLPSTVEQAIRIAAPTGRVITLGFSETPSQIQQKWITAKELTVQGSRLSNRKFPQVIKNISDGKLSLDEMISHTFNYKDIKVAMAKILDKEEKTKKVVLKFYD